MRRYMDLAEVPKVVHLLQDGTSICGIAKRFPVSHSTVSAAFRFQTLSLAELGRAVEDP